MKWLNVLVCSASIMELYYPDGALAANKIMPNNQRDIQYTVFEMDAA